MSAAAEPMRAERVDMRTVLAGGFKIGLLTAVVVVLFVTGSTVIATGVHTVFQSVLVFTGGCLVAFLPATWAGARSADGIAAAALIGLIGTAVFSVVDIAVLRVVDLYPWTWDAVGGGSGWWYLSVWWMLGTLMAWLGALVMAAERKRGGGGLGRLVLASLVVTAGLSAAVAGFGVVAFGPTLVGGAFVVSLAAWSVVRFALRRE